MYTHIMTMIALVVAVSACTLPTDDAGEISVAEQLVELESFATEPEVYALDEPYEPACASGDDCESHPEQLLNQCLLACQAGAEAMAVFCRFIVHPVVSAACWRVVGASPTACSGFCYWYFS
jgi:hypothetical protein